MSRRPDPVAPVSTAPIVARTDTARPTDALVDTAVAVGLAVLAVTALQGTFGGSDYLVAGVVGAVLAAGAASLLIRWRMPAPLGPPMTLVVLLAAFVLGSGAAVPGRATAGLLPGPGSVAAVFAGLVSAWKGVLTTAPPTGVGDGLGVVPYVLGFVAAGAGTALARRTRRAVLPAVPGVAALVAGFLLGTAAPVSVLGHGGLAVVAVLAWGAVRANRPRRSADGIYWPRLVRGLAMLMLVGALGLLVGPRLPFTGDGDRFHLRQQTVPPFDPYQEPSPLAAFRAYLEPEVKDTTLFTVDGLPAGASLRLATMDAYDGVVWLVGGPDAPASGRFERVGDAILPVPPGIPADVTVEVAADRRDVWVPTVGATRSARFEGDRGPELSRAFRYNRDTAAGAVPQGLQRGDRFVLDAQLVPAVDPAEARTRTPVASTAPLPAVPEPITKRATQLTEGKPTAYDKADALAAALRDGTPDRPTFYSDGEEGADSPAASPSGHSLVRILQFLERKDGLVGNGEQYAAAMALMARSLGLPAQVVLGFTPPADGAGRVEVKGDHVAAWVEIHFDDLGWVAFHPTPPEDRRPRDNPNVREKELELSQLEPPPPPYLDVPDDPPELVVRPPDPAPPEEDEDLLPEGLPAWVTVALVAAGPIVALAAIAGLIVATKWLRKRLRRRRGTAVHRLAAVWTELCDRCRDLGAPVPPQATRNEVAGAVQAHWPAARLLAAEVDEAMFGPVHPGDAAVDAAWDRFETEHREVLGGLDRRARWWAALSLASLRPGRGRRPVRRTEAAAPTVAEPAAVPAPAGG